MISCTICDEIVGNGSRFSSHEYGELVTEKRSVIYSTEHFVILPSLGALNKSHILIAPREHYLSFSRLPEEWDNEVNYLKTILNDFNKKQKDNRLIFFEHGTGSFINNSGACIDHAHLHGIWDVSDFTKKLREEVKLDKLNKFNDLHHKANELTGYIFHEDSNQHLWIANNPEAPSQYFRYLYSKTGNLDSIWDWKSAPQIDIVNEVLEYYKALNNR